MLETITNPRVMFLIVVVATVAILAMILYRANADESSKLSLADALMDSSTGRTSYLKLMVFGSWVLAWQVALFYLVNGDDVKPYTLSLLGIFVTQMVLNRASEIFDPRTKAQAEGIANVPTLTDKAGA